MANVECPLDPFNVKSRWSNWLNLTRVQEIENHIASSSCFHPPLKDIVLHGSLDGSTPLLLACEQGDMNSVQHIVEVWGADVRTAANWYTSRKKFLGATPLFVAVQYDHVDVVQYLINKGADVYAIASIEGKPGYLTPLQVAALGPSPFGARFNYVNVDRKHRDVLHLFLEAGANPSSLHEDGNPLWRDCGAYATIALIEHDINLDLRDSRGGTILHHWIDLSSLATYLIDGKKLFSDGTQLLLDRGVDLNARNNKGFTAILYSAHELTNTTVERDFYTPNQLCIFELLLKRVETDLNEKIDALELAGANLLLEQIGYEDEAFRFWREALRLRKEEKEEKIPLHTSGQAFEWETLEQLENIISDPSLHWIHAMTTRLRIYAKRGCCDDRLMQDYALIFQNSLMGNHEDDVKPTMTQLLDLALVFLDSPETHLSKYKKDLARDFAINLPSTLENDHPLTDVDFEKIKSFMKLMLAVDPEWRPRYGCDFFKMLASLPDVLLREDVRKYFSYSARQDNGTLLAEAYDRKEWQTLRLLLHLRSDPNTNGPLLGVTDHVMLGNDELPSDAKWEMIKTSLKLISAADPEGRSTRHLIDYNFFVMLADIPGLLLPVMVRAYLAKCVRRREGLLLGSASIKKDWKTLRFLLHLRADPNATVFESLGNRLLHIVADQQVHPVVLNGELEEEQVSLEMDLGNLLFNYGAHPQLMNNQGKTAVDIWRERNCGEGMQSPKWSHRPLWCRNGVPKLSCLAGKTIHTHGIPHSRPGDLPVELLHFLENN